jgi:hypothetical protein
MGARTDAPQSEQLIFTELRDLARRAQELVAQADAYKHELTDRFLHVWHGLAVCR